MVKIEDFKKIPIGSKFYVQCYQEIDGYLLIAENGTSVIVSGLNENDEPFKMAKKIFEDFAKYGQMFIEEKEEEKCDSNT